MLWPASAARTKKRSPRYVKSLAALADEPHPDGVIAWGGTSIFRLHAGNARILYEVDDEASVVYIINIGRIS